MPDSGPASRVFRTRRLHLWMRTVLCGAAILGAIAVAVWCVLHDEWAFAAVAAVLAALLAVQLLHQADAFELDSAEVRVRLILGWREFAIPRDSYRVRNVLSIRSLVRRRVRLFRIDGSPMRCLADSIVFDPADIENGLELKRLLSERIRP